MDVATALNIYRHEEIDRLRCGYPWRDADWSTGQARKITDGSLDRKKQSALYVHIKKSGEVGLHPGLVTREQAAEVIERAERLQEIPVTFSDEYLALKEVLPALFANLTTARGQLSGERAGISSRVERLASTLEDLLDE